MLHENPLMADIDVNHWRNMQSLVLESAKAKRRIIVIHEDGRVLKLVHSHGEGVDGVVQRIDDAHAAARALYEANADCVDFVAIFERRAFDRYFAAFQDTWRPDEDLDAFVHRTYAILDDYRDELVTHPGPARATLGLQWRVGATYEQVTTAIRRFVAPNSTVVLGVLDAGSLWATLLLRFDAELRADVVTTCDPSRLKPSTSAGEVRAAVLSWVEDAYGPPSLGLFVDLAGAHEMLADSDKLATLKALRDAGRLWVEPAPAALSTLLA